MSIDQIVFCMVESGPWVPSYSFLYFVLFVGALLTAGVALSAFSFYEDFYWGDKTFRDELRFHSSQRNSSNPKPKKI